MKAREYRLRHVNRVLLSIRDINQLITKENNVSALLDKACRVLIETIGYHKAWVVLTEEGVPYGPFYHSGFGEAFSPMERMLEIGEIPPCAKKAVEKKDIYIVYEPSDECPSCPFKNEYAPNNCGYGEKTTMTMPLIIDEHVYGWISVILPTFYRENPDRYRRWCACMKCCINPITFGS